MDKIRIYLSPSNQKANVGVKGYNEAIQMHRLAEKIKSYLLPVFDVRVSDIAWDLEQVAKDSILWKSDLHICLHSDAGEPSAVGTTVFFYAKGGKGEQFANILYNKIAPLSPGKDRGVVIRPGLYELRKTPCPAVLIENFFHTNEKETDHFENFIELYAENTAKSIFEFYNMPFVQYNKKIIQQHVTYDESTWAYLDKHPYASAFYKKWADSYK